MPPQGQDLHLTMGGSKEQDYDVTAPDGSTIRMTGPRPPTEAEIRAAFAKSGIDFEPKAPPPPPLGTMDRLVEGVKRNFHPADAIEAAVTGVGSAIAHPIDTAKAMGQGLVKESERLNTLAQVGNSGQSALNWVPFIGPELAHAAKTIEGGDVAGGLGETAGTWATAETVPRTLQVAGKGLRVIAPQLMEQALRINAPIARKFGIENLGQRAVDEKIMPTKAGGAKAGRLIGEEKLNKADLHTAADARGVSFRPWDIMRSGLEGIKDVYREQMAAGGVRPDLSVGARFMMRNRPLAATGGRMTATALNDAKRGWDNMSNTARRAAAVGGPLGATERLPIELAKTSAKELEQAIPGLKESNRRIMELKGVQLAAEGRAAIPAQRLENMLTSIEAIKAVAEGNPKVGMALAAGRVLRLPKVMGAGAITGNAIGKGLQHISRGGYANAQRALILAMLSQPPQEEKK